MQVLQGIFLSLSAPSLYFEKGLKYPLGNQLTNGDNLDHEFFYKKIELITWSDKCRREVPI
jgi:hypothetical protein